MNDDRKSRWMLLGIVSLLAFTLRLSCWTGLIGSDDVNYSRYAQSAHGTYQLEAHHHAIRFGVLLPVAAGYKFLGVSEWTTVMIPLLASTASVPLLMIICWKLFGHRAGLIAGILYSTFAIQLRIATVLLPEPIAEFMVLASILVYLHAGEQHKLLPWASGLGLGLAYLTKEPALFVVLALLFDATLKGRWRVAILVIMGAGTVIVMEHAYYLATTSDLLFRPHAMRLHEMTPMAIGANTHLAKLLLTAYPYMMLRPNIDFGLHSILCLALTTIALIKQPTQKMLFPMLWASLPWLYLNFGSSSLSHYSALPTQARYIEFSYPPLIAISAAVLDRLLSAGRRPAWTSITVVVLAATAGLACGLATRAKGYRTTEVAVLRSIAQRASEHPPIKLGFDEPGPWKPWTYTMTVLAPEMLAGATDKADLVIRADPYGLPVLEKASRK